MKSLHQKKFRQEYGLFLVEGKKMVEEAMGSTFECLSFYSTDDEWVERNPFAMKVTAQEMDQMSALNTPSKHLAVVRMPKGEMGGFTEKLIVLDGISDPGNMGTIIRTAEWFGFEAVLCTKDCVELFNPKTVQSTMGSLFRMKILYAETEQIAKLLYQLGYQLFGAEMNGENFYKRNFPLKTALVIGSESHGIRPEMKNYLHQSITIPGSGGAESLNASVAAAILMSELYRRS